MAVARQSAEYIARQAVRVNTNQNGLVRTGHISLNQRHVAFSAIHLALIGDGAKFSVRGGQQAFRNAEDVPLVLQTIANKLGDGKYFESMNAAELDKIRHSRPC